MAGVQEAEVVERLIAEVLELMPGLSREQVSAEHSLKDLGLDSMDRVDVILQGQEFAGVRLPMVSFQGARNIGDVARIIAAGA